MPRPVYLHIAQSAVNPLRLLRDKWAGCTKCDLSKIRHKIVHVRGHLPCDVLFIGEAPGESENIVGYPFVGQSGNLLNELIAKATVDSSTAFNYAVINMVACYPGKDANGNFNKPHRNSLKACEPHLRVLIEIAKPRLIVSLGEIAHKKLPPDIVISQPYLPLAHPASISRTKDPREYTLKYTRFVLCLSEAITNACRLR